MAERILLLALLPVIGAAIYMEGQRYDPSTLDFSKSPGEEKLFSLLPEKIGNLHRTSEVRIFSRENLFELVNGHAEFYLAAGFKTAAVTHYRKEKEKISEPSLSVDIYDIDTAENAFGVLMEEGSEGKSVPIGAMGIDLGETVLFIAGQYYVKVVNFAGDKTHKKLAGAIAEKIGTVKSELPQFARFPKGGAQISGRGFVRSDYMGVSLFQNVFEQRYIRNGEEFRAFLLTPPGSAKTFAEKIIAHYKKFDIPVENIKEEGATVYAVRDPYESWAFMVRGKEIIGVAEMEDENDRLSFLGEAMKVDAGNRISSK